MEEPYMGEEIPLRWLLFEEALAADRINYMSLDQVGLQRLFLPFNQIIYVLLWKKISKQLYIHVIQIGTSSL